jgi:hypothetical protein
MSFCDSVGCIKLAKLSYGTKRYCSSACQAQDLKTKQLESKDKFDWVCHPVSLASPPADGVFVTWTWFTDGIRLTKTVCVDVNAFAGDLLRLDHFDAVDEDGQFFVGFNAADRGESPVHVVPLEAKSMYRMVPLTESQ